jgi:hypothetical protein
MSGYAYIKINGKEEYILIEQVMLMFSMLIARFYCNELWERTIPGCLSNRT